MYLHEVLLREVHECDGYMSFIFYVGILLIHILKKWNSQFFSCLSGKLFLSVFEKIKLNEH